MTIQELDFEEEINKLIDTVQEVNEILSDEKDSSEVQTKHGKKENEKVSQTDRDVEEIIRDNLREFGYGLIGEEHEDESGEGLYWIIDPIDGTANYLAGRDYYSVSIALADDKDTYVGVVSAPEWKNGVTAIAVRGLGAYLVKNDELDEDPNYIFNEENKLAVSDTESFESSLGMIEATSESTDREMSEIRMETGADYIQPGSAALELLEIAAGDLDFRVDDIKVWDYAAGHLLVEEAGGEVRTREAPENSGLTETVASNKVLQEDLEDIVNRYRG